MEENKRISDLFESARTEAPKTSFEEVKKHVLATSAVGATGIIAKWTASSFKLKAIIMITTLSTLTISTILIVSQFTNTPNKAEVKLDKAPVEKGEIIEVISEDGIQKTIVYDENNKVVQVIIDPSDNAKNTDNNLQLSIKQAELIASSETGANRSDSYGVIAHSKDISERKEATDSLVIRKFTITQNTTTEELENIMKLATAAGVDFSYKRRVRKGKTKKINMSMIIKGGSGMSEWGAKISGAKSFTFDFGWNEDLNGKAVSIINSCDKIVQPTPPETPKTP